MGLSPNMGNKLKIVVFLLVSLQNQGHKTRHTQMNTTILRVPQKDTPTRCRNCPNSDHHRQSPPGKSITTSRAKKHGTHWTLRPNILSGSMSVGKRVTYSVRGAVYCQCKASIFNSTDLEGRWATSWKLGDALHFSSQLCFRPKSFQQPLVASSDGLRTLLQQVVASPGAANSGSTFKIMSYYYTRSVLILVVSIEFPFLNPICLLLEYQGLPACLQESLD